MPQLPPGRSDGRLIWFEDMQRDWLAFCLSKIPGLNFKGSMWRNVCLLIDAQTGRIEFQSSEYLRAVSDDTQCIVTTPDSNGGVPGLWRLDFSHQLSRVSAATVVWTVALLLTRLTWRKAFTRQATPRTTRVSQVVEQTQ